MVGVSVIITIVHSQNTPKLMMPIAVLPNLGALGEMQSSPTTSVMEMDICMLAVSRMTVVVIYRKDLKHTGIQMQLALRLV